MNTKLASELGILAARTKYAADFPEEAAGKDKKSKGGFLSKHKTLLSILAALGAGAGGAYGLHHMFGGQGNPDIGPYEKSNPGAPDAFPRNGIEPPSLEDEGSGDLTANHTPPDSLAPATPPAMPGPGGDTSGVLPAAPVSGVFGGAKFRGR